MNKNGLVGKIILIIVGIILIIGVIIGITAIQAYNLYSSINTEVNNIAAYTSNTDAETCETLDPLNQSITNLKEDVQSACRNPLIKKFISMNDNVPIKCGNVSSLYTVLQTSMDEAEKSCLVIKSMNSTNNNS